MNRLPAIYGFAGANEFLSNSYRLEIGLVESFKGEILIYPSVEHAYQAMKHDNLDLRREISDCVSAYDARVLSWSKPCAPGWASKRLDVMEGLLLQKFSTEELQQKLINTYDAEIYQVNHWGEIYWGVNQYMIGENHLGKLLMKIRDHLMYDLSLVDEARDSP